MNKKLIVRFKYNDLPNKVHTEYHEVACNVIEGFNPTTLRIANLYAEYKTACGQQKELLDLIRKSEWTQLLVEADEERDRLIHGFINAVKSAADHFDPDKRELANKLFFVLDYYRNTANITYDAENTAIDDMLSKVRNTRQDEITKLDLDLWLVSIENANAKVRTILANRYKEVADRPVGNMKMARHTVDKLFRGMLDYIEAYITISGNSIHQKFIDELNAVSERYIRLYIDNSGNKQN